MSDIKARAGVTRLETANELREAQSGVQGKLCTGRVVRCGVGTYDLLVDIPSRGLVTCLPASSLDGSPFGFSDTDLPLEGSNVLVVLDADLQGFGYVLGSVNMPEAIKVSDASEKTRPWAGVSRIGRIKCSTVPGSPDATTEAVYDDVVHGCVDVGVHKPADVFPGEYVRMNEFGVGLDCDMLSTRLRAGSACIAASFADATVDIVSRNFRSYGACGNVNVFEDAGFTTEEVVSTPYYGERLGGVGRNAKRKEESDTDPSRPVGKFRTRTYEGYIGGVFSRFVSKPAGCTEQSDVWRTNADVSPKDTGLMQLNVNDNGRLMYRSAGGLILERSDLIPVPVRIKDPGNPDGAKAVDAKYDDVLAFEIPKDDQGNRSPHYGILALADRQAYEYKQTYDRFLELISGNSDGTGSDFYLRNESELYTGTEKLDDDAGIPGRKIAPDDLQKNAGRRASIVLPPDGSIILRDAWGSEIVLSGGNITLNTPGNVICSPGKSSICLAGDDIVLKARNSVDVTAVQHDVAVSGSRAVKLVGGSDQSPDSGGVLIESKSRNRGVDLDNPGEDSVFTGITLKASDSNVTVLGRDALLGASGELRLATGSTDKKNRSGSVTVATGRFGVSANDGFTVTSQTSGLLVSSGTTVLTGESVEIASRDATVFVSPSQVGVPLWFDVKFDFASYVFKRMEEYSAYEQNDDRNKPFKLTETMDRPMFTYRTSEQCDTTHGLETTDVPEHFTLYKPFWAVMADLGVGTMENVKTTTWEDTTIDGEYPWPGTQAVNDGKYARLETDGSGVPKNLKVREITVTDESGKQVTKKVLCSEDFDKITGKTGSDAIGVKLDGLSSYVVRDLEK